MPAQDLPRRLSAILSADVEGYSRLMQEDEEATVRTLTAYRTAITHQIEQYRGRVVDSPGDNVLAEFTSVVDAVNCAVEIQRELAERNAEFPEHRRMQFRIGINLGDVLEEGGRIYGDGVNIAARMESLAEAGQVCISGTVHDAVQSKIGLEYEYLGEQRVKNIARPVRAYRVLSHPGAAAHRVVKAKEREGRKWRKAAMAAALVLIIGAAAAVWHFFIRSEAPSIEAASVEQMAYPLPDKPSIAVLSFVNMSGDPEQEYFSDGITEEIITALSKTPKMLVIARNSTFSYKGKAVKVQQVARELGVKYVLEGSVRKAEDRVRITAQLIDAQTGHHLWAESYDRELKDIFALQDQITMKVLTAVRVVLTEGEQALLKQKEPQSLEAYLKVLKGREEWLRCQCKEGNDLARNLASEAIALDPEYSAAYLLLARVYFMDAWLPPLKRPVGESIKLAINSVQKAVELDPTDALAHGWLGYLYTYPKLHEQAIAQGEKAVELAPNSSIAHFHLGTALAYGGKYEEAIRVFKRMFRLNPKHQLSAYHVHAGLAYILSGQYELAIQEYTKATQISPKSPFPYMMLAPAYILSEQKSKARAAAEKLLELNPKFSIGRYEKRSPIKKKEDLDRIVNAMREAGLPA